MTGNELDQAGLGQAGLERGGLERGALNWEAADPAVAHVEHLPARMARLGSLSGPLPEALQAYLDNRGIELWSHQVETIEAVRGGNDVILSTSTASGKTLAFNLPVLERLALDSRATALFVYPMKALANDQLSVLEGLERQTGIELGAAIYDGDTPKSKRPRIRARSRLVITNPYGLHQYLPSHHLWERFFSNLALVIMDEAHWYRGVLGANVAMVVRRLRRIALSYGADPRFVLASATIANPAEHAEALTGRRPRVVSDDGAPRGQRDFVLWNPLAHPNRSPHLQAAGLLARLASSGRQAICFTVSRRMAELVARWAREAAPELSIAPYRAGYSPEERRRIEGALKRHELDAVAATNALELGIDIGRLDAVVMAGYPGTISSTWQQAGRAGRERSASLAILVAFEDPLDQYLVSHPEELFGRPHEQAVVDLANPRILSGHLLCAAAELPLRPEDAACFGPSSFGLVEELASRGRLAKTPVGYAFHGASRPVDAVSLDRIDEPSIEVRLASRPLETLTLSRALSTAHPGAILLHLGDSYRIETLDLDLGVAEAVPESSDRYTEALKHVSIRVRSDQRSRELRRAVLHSGQVVTTEQVYGYQLKSRERVTSSYALELPALELETVALWLELPPELGAEIRSPRPGARGSPGQDRGRDFAGGLHAAEHALIHMMPLLAMCDRRDVGGMSTLRHEAGPSGAIFVYDRYQGGIGIAEKAYEAFERLVEVTLGLLRACPCEEGCPSCVYDRNCGNENQPMDKSAAISILEALLPAPDAAGKPIGRRAPRTGR